MRTTVGRLAVAAAALVMLSACNVVITKDPLFTQKDAAGAPTLRPGVWEFFRQPGCQVDKSKPFTEWPDCVGGGLVSAGMVRGHKSNAPPDQLEDTPVVLASGEPRILQAQVDVDLSVHAEASASGDATASASSSPPVHARPYGYAAARPTKFDSDGNITAFILWPVQCGPPPPKDKNGEEFSPGDAEAFAWHADEEGRRRLFNQLRWRPARRREGERSLGAAADAGVALGERRPTLITLA